MLLCGWPWEVSCSGSLHVHYNEKIIATKQKGSGNYVSSMQPMKLPMHILFHKMCFRFCEPQLSYLNTNTAVCWNFMLIQMPVSCASQVVDFLEYVSNLMLISPRPSSPCVFCMFSFWPKWNLSLEIFSHICK